MRAEFVFGFVISGISGMMFLSGILNLLTEMTVILFLGGFVCFAAACRKRTPLKSLFCFGTVFLIVFTAGLIFLFYGSAFSDQVVFGHWGLVVRQMMTENRFPNFTDPFIVHKTYPTGTASWIYYCLRVTGAGAEYIQLIVQNIIFPAMMIGIFPFAKKKTEKFIASVLIIVMFCGISRPFDLQVDNILVCTALCTVCFCIYYRNDLKQRIAYLLPFIVFPVSVKNTGMFFLLPVLFLTALYAGRRSAARCALVQGGTFYLWQKHLTLVFSDALREKHAVAFSNYRTVFSEKSAADVLAICRTMLGRFFTIRNPFFILLAFTVMLWILFRRFRTDRSRDAAVLCLLAVSFFLIYMAGLLWVYLFSMPLEEALRLSSYGRYLRTAVVFTAGMLLAAFLFWKETAEWDDWKYSLPADIVCLGLLSLSICPHISFLYRQDPADLAPRRRFERIVSENQVPSGGRYIVFTDEGSDPHRLFNAASRFLLFPEKSV